MESTHGSTIRSEKSQIIFILFGLILTIESNPICYQIPEFGVKHPLKPDKVVGKGLIWPAANVL
jgi:hypothetical protein